MTTVRFLRSRTSGYFTLFFSLMACFTALEVQANEKEEELETALLLMILASECRANYGENALYELAFDRIELLARKFVPAITNEQWIELRQNFYEAEPESADEGENSILQEVCESIDWELLANEP
ncbi:hypothetical protein [Boseongicola aestuarii]|uniref:Uncharacterized protein n=1 Tax=Boseongicola aestuarii TaxID=1470561 RepID=A0A238IWY6_9RHOB|nr:hypothetical protein [Boseongicola aestuarii]SMX22492.1 hypothetical protein BOA8489_00589 [Boseongicola aestuarii]